MNGRHHIDVAVDQAVATAISNGRLTETQGLLLQLLRDGGHDDLAEVYPDFCSDQKALLIALLRQKKTVPAHDDDAEDAIHLIPR